MKTTMFIGLVALFLLTGHIYGQTDSKDDIRLRALIKKMTDAQTAYDPATLDRVFAADYVEISPIGEVDPREKVLGFYKPEDKPPAGKMSASVEANDISIRNYGSFAVAVSQFNYSVVADGKQVPPRSMRAMIVFRKEKGDWKITSVQYTGIKQPQPTSILDKKSGL